MIFKVKHTSYVIIITLSLYLEFLFAENKALLVAGSKGYHNYRHQADIAHAYRICIHSGYKPENIIVMMYDDVAHSRRNLLKKVLYNDLHHVNYYKNLVIDYSGKNVNIRNFKTVLGENVLSSWFNKKGKVLHLNADDTLFIYLSDHGVVSYSLFPSESLYSNSLVQILKNAKSKCQNILIVVEACFSGSLFKNHLKALDTGILAITASKHNESSYARYLDLNLQTFIADEFSSHLFAYLEKVASNRTKMRFLFDYLRNNTYGSSPQIYGDKDMLELQLYKFFPRPYVATSGEPDTSSYVWDVKVKSYEVPSYLNNILKDEVYYGQVQMFHPPILNQLFNEECQKDFQNGTCLENIDFDAIPSEKDILCHSSSIAYFNKRCTGKFLNDEHYPIYNNFYSYCQNKLPLQKIYKIIDSVCNGVFRKVV